MDGLPAYRERFVEAMDDDFNTADALAVIFELAREANTVASPEKNPSKALVVETLAVFDE